VNGSHEFRVDHKLLQIKSNVASSERGPKSALEGSDGVMTELKIHMAICDKLSRSME
jgi:hypothetical protein